MVSRDFHEVDSKYLFGSFTRGASVVDEGERAIEPDTRANFGKRGGQYAATLAELELFQLGSASAVSATSATL
jgi:hypothetical protein